MGKGSVILSHRRIPASIKSNQTLRLVRNDEGAGALPRSREETQDGGTRLPGVSGEAPRAHMRHVETEEDLAQESWEDRADSAEHSRMSNMLLYYREQDRTHKTHAEAYEREAVRVPSVSIPDRLGEISPTSYPRSSEQGQPCEAPACTG